MCLLVVLSHAHPDGPLIVAANRDERLSRPAVPMDVLQPSGPRILGGRDQEAGGTWLAVNEHGLVAALTNMPAAQAPRDPAKRPRGELPLALAQHGDVASAVEAFQREYRPAEFNPCWLLAADRERLFYIDMAGGLEPVVRELPPGRYVLENRPLDAASPKAALVAAALDGIEQRHGDDLLSALDGILSSHEAPPAGADPRPPNRLAACVHNGDYGTRWSGIITVPTSAGAPAISYTAGPPCTSPRLDAGALWG